MFRVAAAVAVVIAFFWILSVVVGLLVWLLMVALLAGVVYLGVRMLRAQSGQDR
ncbi:Uncharacterised protein [Nocardiopsis dassonvillei]|uniref:Uncharacterized protein n=1 Tax=Nocardiopsis dassonvillei (strain ATCC 23218 / DSM 43111 / CIP 107115 / JCM 7437 / KCTC 9190 / NBRC 14626 / NCTC 10488 / NRRL B-5397 / IMRU 509) TaxID=446468 RepID=D7AVK5_NOCDD|nr:conserved hypothetical protein [Nocardiopsis dassonvillei subsp. dassonvillei DSM 43111]VEI88093.1 Uncharacterised protein [Nocardiopsis dassonvillei]